MNATARTPWNFEADYLQACNCDYGCPCEFSAPPTLGYCEGVGAWRIHRGRFGTVKLDGLALAFAARWPGQIHEGNGTLQLFFDERADAPQRDALFQICSGQHGGQPFEIIVTTFSRVLDPLYVPIRFDLRGRNGRVRVGDAAEIALAPIRNPVTGEPESMRVEHATGFIFKSAEVLAAETLRVNAGELAFSWPNKAGFLTRVKYGN